MPSLLCESCGYDVRGLPAAGACPECARPIATSLPGARTGTPWQQRRTPWAWLRTNWGTIRRPRETFRVVCIETRSGVSLAAINLLLAGTLLVAPWTGVLHQDPLRALRHGRWQELLLNAGWVIPLQVLGAAAVLLVLTMVEWAGIRFWAKTRGRRLTAAAAWQVVAHASVGWITSGVGLWVMLVAYLNLAHFGLAQRVEALPGFGGVFMYAMDLVGVFTGLVHFEWLVYRGVHECMYANPPGAVGGSSGRLGPEPRAVA